MMARPSRRDQIVEAALELLAEVPLGGVTTRAIAKRVGVSQPALFRHFRSRDDILLAVIDRVQELLEVEVGTQLGGRADEQLSALACAILRTAEAHRGLPRLLFAHAADQEGLVRTATLALIRDLQHLVSAVMRMGQRDGDLRADVPAVLMARWFVGAVQGVILQWELAGARGPLADQAPALVDLWVRGMGADGIEVQAAAVGEPGLVVLDVRPNLAAGEEPIELILGAVEALGPGGVLRVIAPFRPTPLLALLRGRGHSVEVEGAGGRWDVDIVIGGMPAIVDLRDLPAPEPLESILLATADLLPGGIHVARTPQVPELLFGRLRDRGLAFDHVDGPRGCVVWILRPEG